MTQSLDYQAACGIFSIFDFLETFSQDFTSLKQSLMPFLQPPTDPPFDLGQDESIDFQKNNSSFDMFDNKSDKAGAVIQQLGDFENMIGKLGDLLTQENTSQTAKFEKEIRGLKEMLAKNEQATLSIKLQQEQERTHFSLQEDSLVKRIYELENELHIIKGAAPQQLEGFTDAVREERVIRKRMEQWFYRRLETVEYYLNDLKANPGNDIKLNALIAKVGRIKNKQPWNEGKNLNALLNEALLNDKGEKNEVQSTGTATPFSHYAYCFSSDASAENTMNQAFMESQDKSILSNQNILLDTSDTEFVEKPRNELADNFTKQMQSKNLSLTQKERIFCELFADRVVNNNGNPNNNLLHVKLEDILQVGHEQSEIIQGNEEPSISLGSIKFETSNSKPDGIGNGCRRFNQTIKVHDLKDLELENAVSSIQMGTSCHPSHILDSFKQSGGLGSNILEFEQSNINTNENFLGGESDKDKLSLLDKPINSQFTISDHQVEEERKSDASLQNLLCLANESSLNLGREDGNMNNNNNCLNKPFSEISISLIQDKKEDQHGKHSNFLDRLNESSILGGYEDFNNILDKASSDLDLSTSNPRTSQREQKILSNDLRLLIDTSQIGKQSESAFLSERLLLEEKFPEKSSRQSLQQRVESLKQLDNEIPEGAFMKREKAPEKDLQINEEKSLQTPPSLKVKSFLKFESKAGEESGSESKSASFQRMAFSQPKAPSNPRRSLEFRQATPVVSENEFRNIQENSGEKERRETEPVASKLNWSFDSIVEKNYTDLDLQPDSEYPGEGKESPELFKQDYKNFRGTRSQTPQGRSDLQMMSNYKMYLNKGREQGYEMSPPKRRENFTYFKSLSLNMNKHMIYNRLPSHSSSGKPRNDYLDTSASSPHKDSYPLRPLNSILPYEASKNYPAPPPNKDSNQEFCRKVPIHISQTAHKAQSAKYLRGMFEEPGSLRKTNHNEYKPMSPTKKSRMYPEGCQSATFASQIDGTMQFRAKKFASKKT